MSRLEDFTDQLPDFAKDLKLNVKSNILTDGTLLTHDQVGMIAISCAIATKNRDLASMFIEHFSDISNENLNAAKGAAAIMGMNNVYYRFTHTVSNPDYKTLTTGLRMSIIASHGVDVKDFELASLAVSAINGCSMCIDSHESKLIQHSVSKEQIQLAIKIAAIIHGVANIFID
jgi:alkyl hydroperoxide reductase subunit D